MRTMAPWIKFFTALAFGLAGLACCFVWPNWKGVGAFVLIFFIGSAVSQRLFMRFATPEQVRQDLEQRLIDH